MKLHQDNNDNANVVTGYGDDHIMVNKLRHDGNLILTADSIHAPWAPQASGDLVALSAEDLAAVAALRPEIIIVGTGRRQRFPAPVLLRPLIEARIGFEFMDLAAACRTYNILVAESRAVALALLFKATP